MKTICIDPRNDPMWQRLVTQYRSDVFHSPGWLRVLRQTYGFEVRALLVVDEAGDPRAGMAYSKIEDMMDPRIVSLPFSDFCDPLVEDRADWRRLLDHLLAQQCRLSFRCLHNNLPLEDERLDLVDRGRWHCVDLQQELDTIWRGLHSSARRAIRKAEQAGVTVRLAAGKEELRAFFELHLGVRKYKYGLLAQPYGFFENIWDEFIAPQQGALMVAVYEDQIIGGVLFLEWRETLYYKFNASSPRYIANRPNDLVIWAGIQYGQSKGYKYLDFGISDWDQEGLVRYKRKFASQEKTISFLRYMPPGTPTPSEQAMRHLLPQLTGLFVDQSVPDPVTEKAGEALYRFFT